MRLTRRSRNRRGENVPASVSRDTTEVIGEPEITKNTSTPRYPPGSRPSRAWNATTASTAAHRGAPQPADLRPVTDAAGPRVPPDGDGTRRSATAPAGHPPVTRRAGYAAGTVKVREKFTRVTSGA